MVVGSEDGCGDDPANVEGKVGENRMSNVVEGIDLVGQLSDHENTSNDE